MTEQSKDTLTSIFHEILASTSNPLIKAKAAEGIGYIESRKTILEVSTDRYIITETGNLDFTSEVSL